MAKWFTASDKRNVLDRDSRSTADFLENAPPDIVLQVLRETGSNPLLLAGSGVIGIVRRLENYGRHDLAQAFLGNGPAIDGVRLRDRADTEAMISLKRNLNNLPDLQAGEFENPPTSSRADTNHSLFGINLDGGQGASSLTQTQRVEVDLNSPLSGARWRS